MKRFLFLAHRWMGVLLCLFMAMWFISGVVMMYVGYPKLTPSEHRAGLPPLAVEGCCVDLAQALAAAGHGNAPRDASIDMERTASTDAPPDAVRLTTIAGTPRYVFTWARGSTIAVDARNGRRITAVSAADAIGAVRAYAPEARLADLGSVDEDAWTHSRVLDAHRPLLRVQADDADATLYYVSSATGEVVRDATRAERAWNWIGAWIHWLYPFRGGVFESIWADIVIYTSLVATVLALTGMVVGVWRWRFAGRYGNGGKSPYRGTAMRWHHILGLAFGTICVTWIFSGMLSMNPWKVFDLGSGTPRVRGAQRVAVDVAGFHVSTSEALTRMRSASFVPVELEWRAFEGKGLYVAIDGAGRTRVLPAVRDAQVLSTIDADRLIAEGVRAMPGIALVRATMLTEYDAYYYARAEHTMSGSNERRLPMLRLEFADAASTWLHIDPATGSVVSRVDDRGRVRRWLFAFLHSWDWWPLLAHRPWWDVVLILLSIGGTVVSLTGVVIGWRRLGKKLGTQGLW